MKSASNKSMESRLNLKLTPLLFFLFRKILNLHLQWNDILPVSGHQSISVLLCALPWNRLFYLKVHILQLRGIFNFFSFDYSLPYFCIFRSSFLFFWDCRKEKLDWSSLSFCRRVLCRYFMEQHFNQRVQLLNVFNWTTTNSKNLCVLLMFPFHSILLSSFRCNTFVKLSIS